MGGGTEEWGAVWTYCSKVNLKQKPLQISSMLMYIAFPLLSSVFDHFYLTGIWKLSVIGIVIHIVELSLSGLNIPNIALFSPTFFSV